MPATFDYKVRDKTGALVSGQLVGDSEALVMRRLREMGLTPIRVKQASTGLKMEIHLRPSRVKL
jgi:type IV pilus assembly protein PilC